MLSGKVLGVGRDGVVVVEGGSRAPVEEEDCNAES
jgi:hypothetical protein